MCHTFKKQNFITYLHWKIQGLEMGNRNVKKGRGSVPSAVACGGDGKTKTAAEQVVTRVNNRPGNSEIVPESVPSLIIS
jgi:hypothetical protein